MMKFSLPGRARPVTGGKILGPRKDLSGTLLGLADVVVSGVPFKAAGMGRILDSLMPEKSINKR